MSSGRKPAIGSWTTTLATVLAGAVTVLAIGIQLVSHRGTPTPSATPPAARAGTVSVQISAPLSNATALNNLGYFLIERNERLAEALELIQRAVRANPTNASTR